MRITEDEIREYERMLAPVFVARASYEERLRGIPASELVKAIPASELVKALLERVQLDDLTSRKMRELFLCDDAQENEAG